MTIYGPAWPLKKGETDLYQMNKTREQQISFELNLGTSETGLY